MYTTAECVPTGSPVVCTVIVSESVSVEIVWVLPYGGFIQIHG